MEGLVQYLPIIILFAVMIGMTVFQQKKQKKQMQEMADSLKVGVRVRTAGGFIGTIVGIKEDTIIIELDPEKIRVELLRAAVAPLTQELNIPDEEAPADESNDDSSNSENTEE